MINQEIVIAFKKKREGEKHINNEGCEMEIIEYFSCINCTVRFDDGNIVYNMEYSQIVDGRVKNPYHRGVYGVGFFGGKRGTNSKKYYNVWTGVFERCYSKIGQEKHPTYKDCTVDEKWHNFQNFAHWMDENYDPEIMQGWHLDKDILIKGNKVYSPETCCLVPKEINFLFIKRQNDRGKYPIGVVESRGKYVARINKYKNRFEIGYFDTPEEAFQAYKTAKEEYIKEVADKWRGQITEPTYQAMYRYEVEITD